LTRADARACAAFSQVFRSDAVLAVGVVRILDPRVPHAEDSMLKFAICAGISYEWVYGPDILSWHSLGSAAIRVLLVSMLAWMVLEALLDDQPARRIDPRPTIIRK
jgi:hypothetical protein